MNTLEQNFQKDIEKLAVKQGINAHVLSEEIWNALEKDKKFYNLVLEEYARSKDFLWLYNGEK